MSHRYQPKTDLVTGEEYVPVNERGFILAEDPLYNKGTAWPMAEREALGLVGVLPPHVSTDEEQLERTYHNYSIKESAIQKFIFLQALQDRNEVLFYKLLTQHLREMLPIVYTPTVGQACREFHHIFRKPRGLYIAAEHTTCTAELIRNVEHSSSIQVAVVTDGERILGLGDLGANGMGIPIGKLSLYIAGGGFHPAHVLPVLLDVGTNNEELLADPLYLGTRRHRLRGEEYLQAVDQFVNGFRQECPGALLQFEDFSKGHAFAHLSRYRDQLLCFNDDIQGTGAVTLAAILAALRITRQDLSKQIIFLVGSGEAGVGIARTLRAFMAERGQVSDNIFLRDTRGLVINNRPDLEPFKAEFAADSERIQKLGITSPDGPLDEQVRKLGATILVGSTGHPGIFDEASVRSMAEVSERPVILPLSNPNSKSEVVPEDAFQWSQGRALIATGSPFRAVQFEGRSYEIAQCNNAFIFPGLGLGSVLSKAVYVTESMFVAAAKALADSVSQDRLSSGCLLPPVNGLRETSVLVAAAVAEEAVRSGVAQPVEGADWELRVRHAMWIPRYLPYRFEPEAVLASQLPTPSLTSR